MNRTQGFVFVLGVAAVAYAAPASAQEITPGTPQPIEAAPAPPADKPTASAPTTEAAQAAPEEKKAEPFAFADFTWLSGNPRTKEAPLDTKMFTGEFRLDTNFTYSFNKPQDDTIVGSSEIFRSGEFQVTQLGIFPSDKLKIEPWIINGWQSYGKFNHAPGLGGQILYRPNGSVSLLFNNYWGTDTLGNPDRKRVHTDDSIQVKYYDRPDRRVSKAAFTFTFDAGCEWGGGVSCSGGTADAPSQFFLGFMAYNRLWFNKDLLALTVGAGAINNPGRYLVLLPPINGATASSGTPYFTENPGDPYNAWDASVTFDIMPSQFVTFRFEGNYRAANVPYFSGAGGVTPPGGNVVAPAGSIVDGWAPDLRKSENRITIALLVKM